MNITAEQKRRISEVVSIFETGKKEGDYANVSIHRDWQVGDKRLPQITYGKMQTTESGNLKHLLTIYADLNGFHADELRPYLPQMGKQPSMHENARLLDILRDAGRNDPLMVTAQNIFFDRYYWEPALKWSIDNGFTEALSMLVIFDSFIHSGRILEFLRKRFPAVPPSKGGTDHEWIGQYVEARHQWLLNHSDALLRKTVYRTRCFMEQMETGNWDLSKPISANGIIIS